MPAPAVLSQMGDIIVIPGLDAQFRRKFRVYTATIVRTSTVNQIFSAQIQVDPNIAPFLCLSFHCGDTADGNPLTSQEQFLVNAQDNENGYQWADGFVPRTALFGSREFGYNLPDEWAIRANTRITFQIQNMAAAATAGTAVISLRGWQLIPL